MQSWGRPSKPGRSSKVSQPPASRLAIKVWLGASAAITGAIFSTALTPLKPGAAKVAKCFIWPRVWMRTTIDAVWLSASSNSDGSPRTKKSASSPSARACRVPAPPLSSPQTLAMTTLPRSGTPAAMTASRAAM